MTFDTLQYVDSNGNTQEVALGTGASSSSSFAFSLPATILKYEPRSHAPSTFNITWPFPPEANQFISGLVIPFKSRCIVYANRVSGSGAPNSFSGGSILFQGRRTDNPGRSSSSTIQTSITLSDVLWDLGKITFQQAWNEITAGTLTSPEYVPFYWPDVVLFQSLNGLTYNPPPVLGAINTWQQIQEVCNYALANFTGADAPQFQLGALNFTPVYRNWYPMRSAKCLEVIQKCLATHPAVYTEVDYTTTPPTLNFRNIWTAGVAVTLPYAGTDAAGRRHVATDIRALPELIPANVRLYYRINGSFNGQPVSQPGYDFYPSGAAALMNQDFSIDITGATQTETIKNFVSTPLDLTAAFGDGMTTPLNIWQQKIAALHPLNAGGQIPNPGSAGGLAYVSTGAYNASTNPKGIQVLGDDGNDYSLNWGSVAPYLTDDSIYSWFQLASGPITVIKATVKAYFSYSKETVVPGGTLSPVDTVQEHQHTFRCVLCSIPGNEYVLKQTTAVGEVIPGGLAQALWTEQQTLQWKMTHEIWQVAPDQNSLPTIIKPGKHLVNLSGGDPLWLAMNAVPQRVNIEFKRVLTGGNWVLAAQSSISCGPVDHLNPDVLIQLANVFWNRDRARIDTQARLTGNSAGNQVDLSTSANAKENSLPNLPLEAIRNLFGPDATSNNNNQVTLNAPTGQINVVQLDPTSGAAIATGLAMVELSNSGPPSSSTLN